MSWRIILCLITIALVAAQQNRPPDVTDADQQPNLLYYNTGSMSEGSQQERNLNKVYEFLIKETPPDGYATCLGYGDFPDTIFAHTACYKMSDRQNCSDCLQGAYGSLRNNGSRPVGARFWIDSSRGGDGCNTRYEISNFTTSLPSETLGLLGPNASTPPSTTPRVPPPPGPTATGTSSSSNTATVVGAVAGSVVGACVILGVIGFCIKRRKTRLRNSLLRGAATDDVQGASRGPVSFSYGELTSATQNFSEENKLGQGGFGPVYKAVLEDGTQLAVKKLSVGSQQGRREFVNEISIITGIRHKNLVRLLGYCAEVDHRLLVYEFMEKSSLDRALFGETDESLDWQTRFQVAVGVAKGITYLHEESQVQIIHRDIKASNVLLDKMLQPKISDFGISRLQEATGDVSTTRVAGTIGYMAPEYVIRGRLSSKADVFSFGVLLLEIISGRKCMDPTRTRDEEILLQWTWNLYKDGKLEDVVDPRLGRNYVPEEVYRLTLVAMFCTQEVEELRPLMSAVVAMLMGYLDLPPVSSIGPPNYLGQLPQSGWTSTSTSSHTGSTTSSQSSRVSQRSRAQTPLTMVHGR